MPPGSGLQARPRAPHPSPAHQSLPALARRIMGEAGLYVTKPVTDVNRAVTAYSITLSARATSAGGTVTPSALAVLRLIASSNFRRLFNRNIGNFDAAE